MCPIINECHTKVKECVTTCDQNKVIIERFDEVLAQKASKISGGQQQRVMIAMALVSEPSLLIADEPTTALDVTIQAQILRLLRDLCDERGISVLLITHDLGVVSEVCDRSAVLYAGKVIESASTDELLANPQHPYTQALMKAVPIADPRRRKSEKDLNFKPIPSPIHGLDYDPAPSVYDEVEPGHYVLTTDSGY